MSEQDKNIGRAFRYSNGVIVVLCELGNVAFVSPDKQWAEMSLSLQHADILEGFAGGIVVELTEPKQEQK